MREAKAIRALDAVTCAKPAAPVNRPMTDGVRPLQEGLSTK